MLTVTTAHMVLSKYLIFINTLKNEISRNIYVNDHQYFLKLKTVIPTAFDFNKSAICHTVCDTMILVREHFG